MKKQDEGRLGEDIAVDYLKKKGFKIVTRNFRVRAGKIDIIAIDGDTLAFIEVKTRKSREFGTPLESITPWKLPSLIVLNDLNEVMTIELVKNVS